jgi:hypothetical protein
MGGRELSGRAWVRQFLGSSDVKDLEPEFRCKVKAFMAALRSPKVKLCVLSTYRPPERAYLMHWAWKIARRRRDPRRIPSMAGVNIRWWHGDAARSIAAAQEMVDSFDIGDCEVPPSLTSRHIECMAIDLDVRWSGTLRIRRKDGVEVRIASLPRDSTNGLLIDVGASYGVIHFPDALADANHWSTDGY